MLEPFLFHELYPIILTFHTFHGRILKIMREILGTEGVVASHLLQEVLNRVFTADTVEQRLSLLRSDLSPKPITELYGYSYVQTTPTRSAQAETYLYRLILVDPNSSEESPAIALKVAKFKKSFTEDLVRDRLDTTVSGNIVLRQGTLRVEEAEVNELEATGLVDGSKDAISAVLETHFDGYKIGLVPGR